AGQDTEFATPQHCVTRVKNHVPNKILDIAANSLYTVPGIGSVNNLQTDVLAQQTTQFPFHSAHDVA
ncbi:MAG: hypothetical protein WCC08_13305, partial [Terrimicrobiaceae bacterium]